MIEPFQSLFILFGGAMVAGAGLVVIVVAFELLMERLTRPKA